MPRWGQTKTRISATDEVKASGGGGGGSAQVNALWLHTSCTVKPWSLLIPGQCVNALYECRSESNREKKGSGLKAVYLSKAVLLILINIMRTKHRLCQTLWLVKLWPKSLISWGTNERIPLKWGTYNRGPVSWVTNKKRPLTRGTNHKSPLKWEGLVGSLCHALSYQFSLKPQSPAP